jgi:hypothetical protein
VEPFNATDGTVLRALTKLEETVADLRAETGVEAFELRARVRELERRLDELTNAVAPEPLRAGSETRRKPPKAERLAARQRARTEASKTEAPTSSPEPS